MHYVSPELRFVQNAQLICVCGVVLKFYKRYKYTSKTVYAPELGNVGVREIRKGVSIHPAFDYPQLFPSGRVKE